MNEVYRLSDKVRNNDARLIGRAPSAVLTCSWLLRARYPGRSRAAPSLAH